MKAFNAFAMTVAFFISGAVLAADGRKEATMDAGKGAFKLTVSAPDFTDGPYDFSMNKGPVVNDQKGAFVVGETMFTSGFSKTASVFYKARIDRSYEVKTEDQRITSEKLAKIMIEQEGFKGREVQIQCPPAPMDNAEMTCYKIAGSPIFKGKEHNSKQASVVASVSFRDGTMGYSILGSVVETDANKFLNDQPMYERKAFGAAVELYKNSKILNK